MGGDNGCSGFSYIGDFSGGLSIIFWIGARKDPLKKT